MDPSTRRHKSALATAEQRRSTTTKMRPTAYTPRSERGLVVVVVVFVVVIVIVAVVAVVVVVAVLIVVDVSSWIRR